MGQEMGTQRLECLAPVADRGFVRRAKLGQRPAERRIKEDGIVAEPLVPTWGGEDLAANDPLGFVKDASLVREGNMADEAGVTAGDATLAQ